MNNTPTILCSIASAVAISLTLTAIGAAQQPAPSAAALSLLQNAEITPEGGINFHTTFNGKRQRSLAVSPRGSLTVPPRHKRLLGR